MRLIGIFIAIIIVGLLQSACVSTSYNNTDVANTDSELSAKNFDETSIVCVGKQNYNFNLSEFCTLQDFYKAFEFNPDGMPLYIVALFDPIGAYWAQSIKKETVVLIEKIYQKPPTTDNSVDAFRHAYFSFRLSQKIGTKRTKEFTDAYEISNVNKIGSRCMDLWNNQIGRNLFQQRNSTESKQNVCEYIKKAIKENQLVVEPFKIIQNAKFNAELRMKNNQVLR